MQQLFFVKNSKIQSKVRALNWGESFINEAKGAGMKSDLKMFQVQSHKKSRFSDNSRIREITSVMIGIIIPLLIISWIVFYSFANKSTEPANNQISSSIEKNTDANIDMVSLVSVQGNHSEKISFLFITLRVVLPENATSTFPYENIHNYGFMEWIPRLKLQSCPRVEGTCTTSVNSDGSIAVKLLYTFDGYIDDCEMMLHLSNFGDVSKSSIKDINRGIKSIDFPGSWDFQISNINLDMFQEIPFNSDMFEGDTITPAVILISSFGGIVLFNPINCDNPCNVTVNVFDSDGICFPISGVREGYEEDGSRWYAFVLESPCDIKSVAFLSINNNKVRVKTNEI